MASKVSRRRFLASAATGTAAGVAATVVASTQGAETPPLPLPDAADQGLRGRDGPGGVLHARIDDHFRLFGSGGRGQDC